MCSHDASHDDGFGASHDDVTHIMNYLHHLYCDIIAYIIPLTMSPCPPWVESCIFNSSKSNFDPGEKEWHGAEKYFIQS